jgi:hypothetical protein
MAQLNTLPYDRRKAVEYAHRWAYFRNPQFLDFSNLGGNCTNFASQCLYAGSGVMNYTPVLGWYYTTSSDRTASWTGVQYLYNFLTKNTGVGPWATDNTVESMQPGDIIQLAIDREVFHHTPVVVEIRGEIASPENIFVAANTYDTSSRPLTSYDFHSIRFLHIEGVRHGAAAGRRPHPG